MEDQDIIEMYFAREENAIKETDIKYGQFLLSLSLNILQIQEDSEECVNDTYLRAWNAIPPNKPSFFKAWLAKIARNLSYDKYRFKHMQKRKGDGVDIMLSELEDCLPSNMSIGKELEDKEIANIINIFLDNITKEARIIFVRRYFFGDDIVDIANRFNFSDSKVKSSLFRTRNSLREALLKEGVLL